MQSNSQAQIQFQTLAARSATTASASVHSTISKDLTQANSANEGQSFGLLEKRNNLLAQDTPGQNAQMSPGAQITSGAKLSPGALLDYQKHLMLLEQADKKKRRNADKDQQERTQRVRLSKRPKNNLQRGPDGSDSMVIDVDSPDWSLITSPKIAEYTAPNVAPENQQTGTKQNPLLQRGVGSTIPRVEQNVGALYKVFHKIICDSTWDTNWPCHNSSFFEDVPRRSDSHADGYRHLSGQHPISNLNQWIFSGDGIAFIVCREHTCRQILDLQARRKLGIKPAGAENYKESIIVVSEPLRMAMIEISRCAPPNVPSDDSPEEDLGMDLSTYSHGFLYHHRQSLLDYMARADPQFQNSIAVLLAYIESIHGEHYRHLDELLNEGLVSRDDVQLLFCPNDVVITREKGHLLACVIKSWPTEAGSTIHLDGWSWSYNGHELQRTHCKLLLLQPVQAIAPVRDLLVYPLRYATREEYDQLRARGWKFWDLRYQHLMTYTGWDAEKNHFYSNDARCMIDYRTYRQFHPGSSPFGVYHTAKEQFDPWPQVIPCDTVLDEMSLILLPAEIHGFPLKDKKWVKLLVDNIGPVVWNKDAFERLVLPAKTKDLVKALVMVRSSTRRADQGMGLAGKRDDLIAGKGNGLIMLLHGGPGTGKTLTAGTVAELAEMPLYSVTCGDIGTKPETVETYLKTVFSLGKTWNCVLLLDEADVFLEERTLADLKRNCLVSIFLRSLEYYEGILILTTNRAGVFDEAFKSRIQVALSYPTLDRNSRRKIWQNFFDMLEMDAEDMDFEGVGKHMDELADEEINGRQIRNVLTTARQLAMYKEERLTWEILEQALQSSRDFKKI
ncbi:MAG: hypothetical protein MMC33_010834 [Icmadophila ericetorum]|nr:hypothetical protein [Icmadophila ericetorum]